MPPSPLHAAQFTPPAAAAGDTISAAEDQGLQLLNRVVQLLGRALDASRLTPSHSLPLIPPSLPSLPLTATCTAPWSHYIGTRSLAPEGCNEGANSDGCDGALSAAEVTSRYVAAW